MTTHADRIVAFNRHRIYDGNVALSWRGIAMVWAGEEPVLSTVHVEDPCEFMVKFKIDPDDDAAEKIVDSLPPALYDAASDAYLALAEEDGFRVSTDPMTGEQRLVQP